MRNNIFWIVVLFVTIHTFGQSTSEMLGDTSAITQKKSPINNYFFIEVGGSGIGGSINYERIIAGNFGVRAGTSILTNVLMATYHPENSVIDFGLGVTHMAILDVLKVNDQPSVFPMASFGFTARKTPGWYIKFSAVTYYRKQKIVPWFGATVGYSF